MIAALPDDGRLCFVACHPDKVKQGRCVCHNRTYIKTENMKQTSSYVPFVSEVEIFNKTMGKPNTYEPNIPNEKEWKFVYDFVLEELEEYREACEKGDIVGVLDALADLTYVATGNGVMLHGLKDKIWPAYQEVQASNMSKSCRTVEEAEETVKVRSQEQGEPCHYEQVGNLYIVYRTRDKKVMKNINYFKPDLQQFFTNEELNKFHNPGTII